MYLTPASLPHDLTLRISIISEMNILESLVSFSTHSENDRSCRWWSQLWVYGWGIALLLLLLLLLLVLLSFTESHFSGCCMKSDNRCVMGSLFFSSACLYLILGGLRPPSSQSSQSAERSASPWRLCLTFIAHICYESQAVCPWLWLVFLFIVFFVSFFFF